MDSQQIQILKPDVVSINFVAGRLKNYINKWEEITSDSNILDIAHKCPIEFIDGIHPIQNQATIRNIVANDNNTRIIDAEIQNLLNIKVIEKVKSIEGEYISPIFVTPKKNGEYRMILNLKKLNEHVEYHHFKMDTFEMALHLIKQNCYMASVDLRHAYYSVPIDEQYQKYLRFIWKGSIYQYTCLPNGLASAPRLFTKLMKVVYATLRRSGHINIGYIDDSLLIGDTIAECSLNIQDTVKLVSDLGFIVHEKKSVLIPTKKIQFLGFLIDSEKMIVTLTLDKKEMIHEESQKLLSKQISKIREVASYIGLIISSFSAVDYGQLYYRDIEIEKIHALKMAKGNFDVNMEITDKMKKEIIWWSCNIYTQSRVLDRVNPQIILQTDASLSGWGAVLIDNKTGGRWTPDEQKYHINYLELLAILYGLKSFESQLKCFTHVKILTDNTTAVSYVNKMGGIKSICCNTIAKSIWFWAKKHNVWLTASHIAGTENTIADAESRKFNDQVEWQLNKDIFCDICELWGDPQIDLFASRLNSQLKRFCSWKPDPDASFIDAFSIDWSDFKCYLFPPFSLLGRCVQKILKDKTTVILVAPLWPTQAWFTLVMQMLIDTPILIMARTDLLTLPYKDTVHPLNKTWNLIIWSCIRKQFIDRGISTKTASIMLCSWRKSTKKQYKVFVKKWFSYCRERKISEVQISINIVLDYLTILFENGLGYSSINTARSALSALGLVIDNVLVGAHPLVVRFMKGVYNLRPTKSKNICVWDVSLVLNYLRKLSPVNMLTLQEVTLKLVMLIALTNATRVQTLKFLSVDCMEKLRDEFVFHLDVLLKQSRPGYKNPDVKLRAFPPDRRLCVYTVLKEYIKRTKILRVHTKQLLISYIKPHKAVTCSTISRWIKVVLQKSGIDTRQFSAHSVRSAATSKAKLYNVSLADIMSKAGWTNVNTFATFYNKRIINSNSFDVNVLNN